MPDRFRESPVAKAYLPAAAKKPAAPPPIIATLVHRITIADTLVLLITTVRDHPIIAIHVRLIITADTPVLRTTTVQGHPTIAIHVHRIATAEAVSLEVLTLRLRTTAIHVPLTQEAPEIAIQSRVTPDRETLTLVPAIQDRETATHVLVTLVQEAPILVPAALDQEATPGQVHPAAALLVVPVPLVDVAARLELDIYSKANEFV